MPITGMAKNTKRRRNRRLIILKAKVVVVLPRPFRILFKVLAMYMKGQRKLRVMMKLPARELSYRRLPAKRPKSRKRVVQITPRMKPYWMDLRTALRMAVWLALASASDTMGSRRTETELVMAEGKRIRGSAIPVSTPYTLRALALS